jgi:hypothetical protein
MQAQGEGGGMSRSNYSDECDGWQLIMWRGAVTSAIRGKRGQDALKELLSALDAMPEKRLIADELERDGEYCTLGVLGKARGIDMAELDPYEPEELAKAFNLAPAMLQEIEFENDEDWSCRHATPEQRWQHMRDWVASQIREDKP